MVIYQSVLTSISDFFFLSEVVIMWQTDGTAYKLKPRLFTSLHISKCYDSMLEVLSKKLTLVLSGTRELDRELFYKLVYLI